MTSDGTLTYTYDDEGRIISVDNGGTGTYVYEADGLRVHRVGAAEGPEDYVYNLSDQMVATILANGTSQRREIYGGTLHVATYTSQTTFFDYTDWQGSERVRSNVSGVSFETCTNLPYGDDQSCLGSSDPSQKHFTGKLRDTETGLDYSNARYYSSNSGRWMLPDWSAVPEAVPYADPSNPQTLNLYTYVGNNPINGIDADGHAQTTDNQGHPCGNYGVVPKATSAFFNNPAHVSCGPSAGAEAQQKSGWDITKGIAAAFKNSFYLKVESGVGLEVHGTGLLGKAQFGVKSVQEMNGKFNNIGTVKKIDEASLKIKLGSVSIGPSITQEQTIQTGNGPRNYDAPSEVHGNVLYEAGERGKGSNSDVGIGIGGYVGIGGGLEVGFDAKELTQEIEGAIR